MSIYERKNAKGQPTGLFVMELVVKGVKHKESSRDLASLRARQAAIVAGVVPVGRSLPPVASLGASGRYTVGNLLRDCRDLWVGHKDEVTSAKRFEGVCAILGHDTLLAAVRTPQLDHVVHTLKNRQTRKGVLMDNKTVRAYLSAFSRAMKWACERDLIAGRPVFPWPKKTKGNKIVITEQDEARVLNHLEASGARDVALVMDVLLATGARISEVTKLEPEHVDQAKGILTFADTKNDETRAVFVDKALAARVLQLIYHGMPTTRRVRWHMQKARKALGIDYRVSPHVMRHTVGTRLDEQGVSLATIGAQLGHKQVSTTMGYVHPQRDALKRVSSLLARTPRGQKPGVIGG